MALTREQIRDWLEASCAAQGVPMTIEDPTVVRQVTVLLTGRAQGGGAQRPGPAAGPSTAARPA